VSRRISSHAARWYRDRHGIDPQVAAGLVQLRRPMQQPNTLVGVYDARQAGLEDSGFATVCEAHGRLVIHDSRRLAASHATDPRGWCGVCNGTEPGDVD
jgi:hypothetical protein